MTKSKLSKHYGKLNMEERVDLIIEASKRGDREEIRKLINTYPEENTLHIEIDYGD